MKPAATERMVSGRKRVGRWVSAGVGFAAAYYLDPVHGEARRQQASSALKRWAAERRQAGATHQDPAPLHRSGHQAA